MQVVCAKCGQLLAGDDINVATDVARCSKCNEVFALSSLVQARLTRTVDVDSPPKGAWYREQINGFLIGATTRHAVAAFFLVPFLGVWSGLSLGGIYGSQIAEGRFDLTRSLFGIPFFLGTLLLGSIALMSICGKVVVKVSGSEGVVFTGVGPFGWRRRFDPVQITSVRVESVSRGDNHTVTTIVLDGPYKLRFGSMLREARRDFIAGIMRHALTRGVS